MIYFWIELFISFVTIVKRISNIRLNKTPIHINEFLTHWTGRKKGTNPFDILSTIISTRELKLSTITISFPNSKINFKTKAICFTDTPIKHSYDHCRRYNYFGISFDKEELIKYGASPVLYLVSNRKRNQEFINNINYTTNEDKSLMAWVKASLQPYDTKKFKTNNWAEFQEREWRINRILPLRELKAMELAQGSFNEFPFKGKIRRLQVTQKSDEDEFYLKFKKSLIKNIIVPVKFRQQAKKLIRDNNLKCKLILLQK
jgi:hypothetical protein